MKRRLRAMLAAAAFLAALPAQALDLPEARRFFDRYVALGQAFDPEVAALYADEAAIKARRRYPNGHERVLELDGIQWKALVKNAIPLAKAQNDRSEYRNVKLEIVGDTVRIRADRYVVRKCYWDRGYAMVVKQSGKDLQIVE